MMEQDMISRQLKERTARAHQRVESLDFHRLLWSGRLPPGLFRANLECLLTIHRALERSLAAPPNGGLARFWDAERSKTEPLRREIELFPHSSNDGAIQKARERAERYAETISRTRPERPRAFLGHLYVHEGSTMGGMVLSKKVAEVYDVDREDLAFHGVYGRNTRCKWQAFLAELDGMEWREHQRETAVEAARNAFEATGDILDLLVEDLPPRAAG